MDTKNLYCIQFEIPENLTVVQFVKKMNDFLGEIENFNHSIIQGIDETYTVNSYIEDLEKGSIRWWLKDKLQNLDDKAIDKFVEKPIHNLISNILKISKRKAIELLAKGQHQKILPTVKKEIEKKKTLLEQEGDKLFYQSNINEKKMLASLSKMSQISKELNGGVSMGGEKEEELKIPSNFEYSYQEKNETLKENEIIDIYELLTPSSREDLKWELKDGENKIKCILEDKVFFQKYKKNTIKLGGNEKLKIKMKILTQKTSNNKIKKEYFILKIVEIID